MSRRGRARLTVLLAITACTVAYQPANAGTVASDAAPGRRPPRSTAPLPDPVDYQVEPDGAPAADPAFEAVAGATASYGYLGGAAYRLEVPDDWNGRLVMWMHGFEDFAPQGRASTPDLRHFLIRNGYAWAGSSYSSTSFIPDRGAEETAALWDHFTRTVGRPRRTYGLGISMGGWSAQLVAERHAERFDGALALCGASGTTRGRGVPAEQLVAGAFAAGVTQSEIDAAPSIAELVEQRIRPALDDPNAREVFESILIELTGGPRPFAVDGLRTTEDVNWRRGVIAADARVIPPPDGPYELGVDEPFDADAFEAQAVTFAFDRAVFDELFGDMATTGRLRIPLLTMHSTGDGQSPIIEALHQRRAVDEAGAGNLLVQRVYRDPGHCGFTATEQEQAFDDLVRWVERDERPAGTDLGTGDLSRVDGRFEEHPRRPASRSQRDRPLHVGVAATIDGQPFDASWIGAVVIDDGLVSPCNDGLPAIVDGRADTRIFTDTQLEGCARPGRAIVFWTFVDDVRLFSTDSVTLDHRTRITDIDVAFDTSTPQGAAPPTTEYFGEAFRRPAERIGSDFLIEALVGNTTCGVTSTRDDSTFIIAVATEHSIPGCVETEPITFRLDHQSTDTTVTRDTPNEKSLFVTVDR